MSVVIVVLMMDKKYNGTLNVSLFGRKIKIDSYTYYMDLQLLLWLISFILLSFCYWCVDIAYWPFLNVEYDSSDQRFGISY